MEGSWLWEKCKHETDAISGRGNTVIFLFQLVQEIQIFICFDTFST